MHNYPSAKKEALIAWRLALRNFTPTEERFQIEGVSFRVIRFDTKLDCLDCLSEVIVDEIQHAVGVIWINSGLDTSVPCIVYDCSQMFKANRYTGHREISVGPYSLANAIDQALVDARFADCDSVAVFESRYNPDCIGWMLETSDPLQIAKNEGWRPKSEDDSW